MAGASLLALLALLDDIALILDDVASITPTLLNTLGGLIAGAVILAVITLGQRMLSK